MEFPIAGYSLERFLQIIQENDPSQSEILKENNVKDAILLDLNKNQGFASKIYRVQIFFDDPSIAPVTFVVKIPTTELFENVFKDMDERPTKEDAIKMHNRECTFYDAFKFCDVLPKPKIFYAEKSVFDEKIGILVMEDLSFWTRAPLIYTSLTENLVLLIVENLAKFHAYQIKNTQLYKAKFNDCVFFQMFDCKFSKSMLKKLTTIIPGKFDDLIFALNKIISDNSYIKFAVRECCQKLGLPTVVCLGDLWSSNILKPKFYDGSFVFSNFTFNLDTGFSLKDEVKAFVDFQLCFEGNPAFDIARLVTLCTDVEIRKSLEEKMFEHYYNVSKNLLDNQEANLFMPEKLKIAYKYAMVHQAIYLATAIPVFYDTLKTVKDRKWASNLKILEERAKNALIDAINFLRADDNKWL